MADHTFGATIDSLTLRNDEVTPEFVGHSAKKISMQVQNPEPYTVRPTPESLNRIGRLGIHGRTHARTHTHTAYMEDRKSVV